MKKISIYAILCILLLGAFWSFYSFGTGRGFHEYVIESEYRRLHPDLIPSPTVIKIFDMGHSTSYASFAWLEFIQYIADNLGGNKYLDFSNIVLEQITRLHPYFKKPYEIALILSPFSRGENQTPEQKEKNKILTEKAITLGKKGMTFFCDQQKIETIKQYNLGEELWNNIELQNPCIDGILPYYIAFAIYQMGNNKTEASEYYKIASMNSDSPIASRQLGIIALAAEGDFRASAMTFALIGADGYDTEPYLCRNLATTIVHDIEASRPFHIEWINELQKKESTLKGARDPANPLLSQSSDNCYDMTRHSIKALYLGYITEMATGSTATNGDDLIKMGLLTSIPTLSTYQDFTVRKINGIWEYGQNLKQ